MRTGGKAAFLQDASFEAQCDAMLLGRLGHELAGIYQDALQAPLPAKLHALIERLETVLDPDETARRQETTSRDRFSD
jgi:hypothetical protein